MYAIMVSVTTVGLADGLARPETPGDGQLQDEGGFHDDIPGGVHAHAHLDRDAVPSSPCLLNCRGARDHEANLGNGLVVLTSLVDGVD